jgi:hypothetical protein
MLGLRAGGWMSDAARRKNKIEVELGKIEVDISLARSR